MPNWMTNLYNGVAAIGARPLRTITILGSHDAGCYVDRGFYANFMARTQTQTIANQLLGGVRYFDIRPCRGPGGTFWTYHGPYWGDQIDGPAGILNQVLGFMNGLGGATRELVILNISHFYGFTPADHVALTGLITATLGAHLIPATQAAIDLFEAPYTNLLTGGGAGALQSRVAILYDGAMDTPVDAWVAGPGAGLGNGFFRIAPKYAPANPIELFDQYAGKRWVGDSWIYTGMRTDQLLKLRNRANYTYTPGGAAWPANAVGGVPSTLHLFSWTLTPQPLSDPLTVAQNESNPALLAVFTAAAGWAAATYDPLADPMINILYVDDYAAVTHVHGGCPMNGWAEPVAIASFLNDYPAGGPWPGWGGF